MISAAVEARRDGVTARAVRKRRRVAAERERAQAAARSAYEADVRSAAAELVRDVMRERDAASARADEAEAYVAALEQARDKLADLLGKATARGDRFSQECRDHRKRSPIALRFAMLGYTVYDLLPPSVWTSLLAGHDVRARFDGPALTDEDRDTYVAMDERGLSIAGEFVDTDGAHRDVLRMVLSVRESIDIDEDVLKPDGTPKYSQTDSARRNRFGRFVGAELYGEVDDDKD